MEGLIADRFKKRGMSWRPQGAGHLCQAVELEGERGAPLLCVPKAEGPSRVGPKGHGLFEKGGEKGSGGLAQMPHADP